MTIILNLEPENYSPKARAVLDALGQVRLGPLPRAALLEALADVDVLIVRLAHQIDCEVLQAAPRLRVIVSATTGLDHIDLDCAARRGVTVLSLRGEYEFLRSIPATAEHTWALLLALVRRIPAAFASVLQGEWDRDRFKGHDLAGQRLGILGLGRIGEKIARYGQVFGMEVYAYDPYRQDWPAAVRRLSTQEELLSRSDVLTIHVPLNEETVHLVDAAALSALRRGALLVNTSRGQIVDEAALLEALRSGHLGGAALDVLADERGGALAASPLLAYAREHDNLLLTPHIGGATYESMAATEVFMAEKLRRFLQGAD